MNIKQFLALILIYSISLSPLYAQVDLPSSDLDEVGIEENSAQEKIEPSELENENESKKIEVSPAPDDNVPKVLRGHISKIPTGTKLKIIIETPVSEDTSAVNDEVRGKVLKPVYIDKELVIPAGSEVLGNLVEINQAKKFHRAGKAKIEFKSIKMEDGFQIPISATVLTHKGTIKGGYTKKSALISAGSILGPAAAGAGAGALIDSSPIGIIIGAGIGTVAGIGLFLYEKGNKLNIKAGQKLNIELTEDALIKDGEIKPDSESDKNHKDFETNSSDTSSTEKGSNVLDFTDPTEVEEGK